MIKGRKPLKKKSCRICKTKFTPFSSLAVACSPMCAIEVVKEAKAKKQRKQLKEGREKLKTLTDHLNEAQKACNAYIRERDKGKPCISCGTMKSVQYCAGHYKTRGAHPELRFHPLNIHKQCNQYCNLQLSGNISNYRPKLIEKIGISQVEWLEGHHEAQKFTIEDAKEIKAYYKEQLKLLRSGV